MYIYAQHGDRPLVSLVLSRKTTHESSVSTFYALFGSINETILSLSDSDYVACMYSSCILTASMHEPFHIQYVYCTEV